MAKTPVLRVGPELWSRPGRKARARRYLRVARKSARTLHKMTRPVQRRAILLLPACGEKVGMRGPLRWAENSGTVCNAAAQSRTLRIAERPPHPRSPRSSRGSLDLSPHAGRGDNKFSFSRHTLVIARSDSDEAIQNGTAVLDCFAEPVIGPATPGRTRWLAMTQAFSFSRCGFLNSHRSFCASHWQKRPRFDLRQSIPAVEGPEAS